MQACAVSEISPAATSLRSWTAAGVTVLHEAFLRYRASLYGTDFFESIVLLTSEGYWIIKHL